MNIEKIYYDKDLTVIIEGRVDTFTSGELESSLNEELENITSLTLDFTELEYLSSMGLRVLIKTQKKLKQKEISMIINNVNENIYWMFKMSGFDKILDIQ